MSEKNKIDQKYESLEKDIHIMADNEIKNIEKEVKKIMKEAEKIGEEVESSNFKKN